MADSADESADRAIAANVRTVVPTRASGCEHGIAFMRAHLCPSPALHARSEPCRRDLLAARASHFARSPCSRRTSRLRILCCGSPRHLRSLSCRALPALGGFKDRHHGSAGPARPLLRVSVGESHPPDRKPRHPRHLLVCVLPETITSHSRPGPAHGCSRAHKTARPGPTRYRPRARAYGLKRSAPCSRTLCTLSSLAACPRHLRR